MAFQFFGAFLMQENCKTTYFLTFLNSDALREFCGDKLSKVMRCGAKYATSASVKFNKNISLMLYFKTDNPMVPGSSPGGAPITLSG